MKIYNVIIEDKHIGVTVHSFSTEDLAVSEAKKVAKDFSGHSTYCYEPLDDSCLFYVVYPCGCCGARVVKGELDKEIL